MTSPFNPGTGPATSRNNHSPNIETQPPTSQIHPFPDPQTFTFLPQLYNLISRLAPLQSPPRINGTTSSSSAPHSTTRVSRSPPLTRRSGQSGTSVEGGSDSNSAPLSLTQTRSREGTIEIKDLPALVYPLRQQIEKAKDVVRGLPDVERSIGDQEREIAELEARISGLKGRLGLLGRLAGDGTRRDDVVMRGLEG